MGEMQMKNTDTIILRYSQPILKENKQTKLISEIDRDKLKQIILEELRSIDPELLEEAISDWISKLMPGSAQSKLEKYMDPQSDLGRPGRGPQGASPEVDEPARMTPGSTERSWRKEFVFSPEQEMIIQNYAESDYAGSRWSADELKNAVKEQVVKGKDLDSIITFMQEKIAEEEAVPVEEPQRKETKVDRYTPALAPNLPAVSRPERGSSQLVDQILDLFQNLDNKQKEQVLSQLSNLGSGALAAVAEKLDIFADLLTEAVLQKVKTA